MKYKNYLVTLRIEKKVLRLGSNPQEVLDAVGLDHPEYTIADIKQIDNE